MRSHPATLSACRATARLGEVDRPVWVLLVLLALLSGPVRTSLAAELKEVQSLFLQGQYLACVDQSRTAIDADASDEAWHLLLAESLMATGQYSDALAAVTNALRRYSSSIQLRLLAHRVYLYNSDPREAREALNQIPLLIRRRSWAYRDAVNLVTIGRAALLFRNDARRVLEQFYDPAKALDPEERQVYLASGELALDKGDYQLASQTFQAGLKVLPEDPDLHYGLARSFAPSNRRQMLGSLERALSINTNHVPSYLLLADHLIDGEEYDRAADTLDLALAVQPVEPMAWAYRAVLAHLQGDSTEERRHRGRALEHWTNNPAVDHLIGRKLSQKYRFQEGSAYQRLALGHDPEFLPARIQLAQDLLRLGQTQEGWALAEQVHESDGYDVTAFNLTSLKEVIDGYAVLTNRDFIIRMTQREADLYGEHALRLLQEAKDTLCSKYNVTLDQPTTVEIFNDQKDFGVRTFGMPDNPGFLGVCFGPVITANSPASRQASPNNWEAVLWHEFCHVVTLTMTRNKMPRWLSEGISVYEERQRNPAWGQIMTPRYREMILGEDLTPIAELSAAFLAPPSDLHLQFAYYESYLVVDFIVRRHGQDSLRRILLDLGEGVEINTAIARHTAPLKELEETFATFARARAEALGPGLDWERPEPEELARQDPDWLKIHADNYYVLMDQANRLLEAEQWNEAKAPLLKILEAYPDQRGDESAYGLLALAHRQLQEFEEERALLAKLAVQDADAVDTFLRLMELDREREAWDSVVSHAQRYLAVNPLVAPPYRFLAQAAEATGADEDAILAYRSLLLLDAPDNAELHFRLARLYHAREDPRARRHVLQALEEAPRFRDAHRLLLEMVEPAPPQLDPAPAAPVTPPAPPKPAPVSEPEPESNPSRP